MNGDPKQFLLDELTRLVSVPPASAAKPASDEQRWLEYVPLAARLAALGDAAPLQRWPELARPFAERVELLLVERAREGMWDLSQTLGQDLGLALIDAQDFACFWRRERKILPGAARRMLAAWKEAADDVQLDEEAAAMLRRFLRRFPLPARERLLAVDAPRAFSETIVLAAFAGPRPTVDVAWPPSPTATAAPLAAIGRLDDGRPSDRLKRVYERLAVVFEAPGVGRVAVSRRVNDDWQVVVDVQFADGDHEDARRLLLDVVRLGRVPGRAAGDMPGRWLFDLSAWEHAERLRWMEEPLVLGFQDGCRLRLQ
ncbi:MAG: hypothetical protein U0939_12115 [Pirellulales bacterium]